MIEWTRQQKRYLVIHTDDGNTFDATEDDLREAGFVSKQEHEGVVGARDLLNEFRRKDREEINALTTQLNDLRIAHDEWKRRSETFPMPKSRSDGMPQEVWIPKCYQGRPDGVERFAPGLSWMPVRPPNDRTSERYVHEEIAAEAERERCVRLIKKYSVDSAAASTLVDIILEGGEK